MSAIVSPQLHVVGESSQNPKETMVSQNPKPTYAERITGQKCDASKSKIELCPVTVIHGEPTVEFTIEEVNSFTVEEGLHQAVILKFSYGKPELHELRQAIPKQFNVKGFCNVGQLEYRHILIRFDLFDDFVQALSRTTGYISAKGEEFFYRTFPWTIGFNPREETSKAVVWISLPDLPANFFAKKSLLSIASAVGKPLALDKATQDRTRPSTARVKVLLDLLDKHPKRVRIKIVDTISGRLVEHYQQIVYDNLPKFCTCCKHQGHDVKSCRWKIEKSNEEDAPIVVVEGQSKVDKLEGDARDYLNAKRAEQMVDNIAKTTVLEKQELQTAKEDRTDNLNIDRAVNDKGPAFAINLVGQACDEQHASNAATLTDRLEVSVIEQQNAKKHDVVQGSVGNTLQLTQVAVVKNSANLSDQGVHNTSHGMLENNAGGFKAPIVISNSLECANGTRILQHDTAPFKSKLEATAPLNVTSDRIVVAVVTDANEIVHMRDGVGARSGGVETLDRAAGTACTDVNDCNGIGQPNATFLNTTVAWNSNVGEVVTKEDRVDVADNKLIQQSSLVIGNKNNAANNNFSLYTTGGQATKRDALNVGRGARSNGEEKLHQDIHARDGSNDILQTANTTVQAIELNATIAPSTTFVNDTVARTVKVVTADVQAATHQAVAKPQIQEEKSGAFLSTKAVNVDQTAAKVSNHLALIPVDEQRAREPNIEATGIHASGKSKQLMTRPEGVEVQDVDRDGVDLSKKEGDWNLVTTRKYHDKKVASPKKQNQSCRLTGHNIGSSPNSFEILAIAGDPNGEATCLKDQVSSKQLITMPSHDRNGLGNPEVAENMRVRRSNSMSNLGIELMSNQAHSSNFTQAHSSNAHLLHFSNPQVEQIIKDAQKEMMLNTSMPKQPLVTLNTSVFDVPSQSVASYGEFEDEHALSTGNNKEIIKANLKDMAINSELWINQREYDDEEDFGIGFAEDFSDEGEKCSGDEEVLSRASTSSQKSVAATTTKLNLHAPEFVPQRSRNAAIQVAPAGILPHDLATFSKQIASGKRADYGQQQLVKTKPEFSEEERMLLEAMVESTIPSRQQHTHATGEGQCDLAGRVVKNRKMQQQQNNKMVANTQGEHTLVTFDTVQNVPHYVNLGREIYEQGEEDAILQQCRAEAARKGDLSPMHSEQRKNTRTRDKSWDGRVNEETNIRRLPMRSAKQKQAIQTTSSKSNRSKKKS